MVVAGCMCSAVHVSAHTRTHACTHTHTRAHTVHAQFTDVGVVTSLEVNHKPVDSARQGMEVCVKIGSTGGDAPRLYGRHFDHTDLLVSKVGCRCDLSGHRYT